MHAVSLRPKPACPALRHLFTGLAAALLLTIAPNVTRAEPTAFGADVVEKNGPVDGYGVVWALEVSNISPASAAEAAGLKPGDVIVNVQLHSDKLYTSGGQSDMVELLNAAAYKDSYLLSVLRRGDGGAQQMTLEVRVPLLLDTGPFQSPDDKDFYKLIYLGDWDKVYGKKTRTAEENRGLAKLFRETLLLYHNVFSQMCPDEFEAGDTVIQEQFVKEYDDDFMQSLYGYEGKIYTWYIRKEYVQSYNRARSGVGMIDALFGADSLVETGRAVSGIIVQNGCGTDTLQQFERNLEAMFRRANPI